MSADRVGQFRLDLGVDSWSEGRLGSRQLITKWFVEAWWADVIGKELESRAKISFAIRHIKVLIEVDRAFGVPTPRIEDWS